MNFMQPVILAALPLMALPIIIHLINQRRYQTMPWGAMMFLLTANRMSRGYARLRQWLILALRTLAVAALIFAVARPLSGGWMGAALGGRPDTTIVLLDRSASMSQLGSGGGMSKLESGRQRLASTLNTLGSTRWVLIDSLQLQPRELNSPDDLASMSEAELTSASADLPAMLEAAAEYIEANQAGRTEIWICSDLRANDWNAESGRWKAARDRFLQFTQGVRFHLLTYAQPAERNLAIRVTEARLRNAPNGNPDDHELQVSLEVRREGPATGPVKIPIEFNIEGARSVLTVEFEGPQYELQSHPVALPRRRVRGRGVVSIPADSQAADNAFYFAFDKPAPRKTVLIVAEDPQAIGPLELAASIAPDSETSCPTVEMVPRPQAPTAPWEEVGLVVWQATLPDDDEAALLESLVERGGRVLFLPPRNPNATERFGARWGQWKTGATPSIASWRSDNDLLSNTESGAALPVGGLKVQRYCELVGDLTPLAEFEGGQPLLGRAATEQGGVYFCATTPAQEDSSLARDGLVLYGLTHRALALGAEGLGSTRQLEAGAPPPGLDAQWTQLEGDPATLSSEYSYHAGVYEAGERLVAVNRPASEETTDIVADEKVAELFSGLDWVRVNDQAGGFDSLVQEIWRIFLVAMIVAMIGEALLCLPKQRTVENATEGAQ